MEEQINESKAFFKTLVGEWQGPCKTWFEPGELSDESNMTARFEAVMDGQMIRHCYAGALKEKERFGEELIACNGVTGRYELTWFDSFHMHYAIMFFVGEATPTGFSVFGKYEVALGEPAWGWRTVYELVDNDQLIMTAYNVSPQGDEDKALETVYSRLSSS